MTSINTNNSAAVALKTLRSISQQLDQSQERVSTGFKVNSAKDNAAYFSIATNMRSDIKSLSTIEDLMGVGQAKVDTAANGTDAAIETVQKIKDLLVSAKESSADKGLIQKEITQLQAELVTTAKASSFNGVNMLHKPSSGGTAATQDIAVSISRDSSGNTTVINTTVSTADTILIDDGTAANGILSQSRTGTNSGSYSIAGGAANLSISSSTTTAQLDDMIEAATEALSDLQDSGSKLGAISSGVDRMENFVKNLKDTASKGLSSLIDTDMEEESAKLAALQAKQQLAIQSLSMANDNPSNILALFR